MLSSIAVFETAKYQQLRKTPWWLWLCGETNLNFLSARNLLKSYTAEVQWIDHTPKLTDSLKSCSLVTNLPAEFCCRVWNMAVFSIKVQQSGGKSGIVQNQSLGTCSVYSCAPSSPLHMKLVKWSDLSKTSNFFASTRKTWLFTNLRN